jgi:hypothetical protein
VEVRRPSTPRPSPLVRAAASGAARAVCVEADATASESARLTPIVARSAHDKDPQSITGHAPAEATRAATIGAAPGTASAIGVARAESTSAAVPGPLLPSPPMALHRSPASALAVSHPLAPPSRSPALRSGLPPTSAPSGEICAQDAASPVSVFAATDATGAGPARTSVDRAGRISHLHTT